MDFGYTVTNGRSYESMYLGLQILKGLAGIENEQRCKWERHDQEDWVETDMPGRGVLSTGSSERLQAMLYSEIGQDIRINIERNSRQIF